MSVITHHDPVLVSHGHFFKGRSHRTSPFGEVDTAMGCARDIYPHMLYAVSPVGILDNDSCQILCLAIYHTPLASVNLYEF